MPDVKTKERPIIFSGEMIKAILDGKKSQSRRVIKPQPREKRNMSDGILLHWYKVKNGRSRIASPQKFATSCPYGNSGDTLWVRESWICGCEQGSSSIDHAVMATYPDGNMWSGDDRMAPGHENHRDWCLQWNNKPSIHMPRWASRITLEITDVRVERVQDISEEDAIAEGIPEWANKDDIVNGHYLDRPLDPYWCPTCDGQGVHAALGENLGVTEVDCDDCNTSIKLFRNLWDSINAKKGYGWESNPFVWCISFRRIK